MKLELRAALRDYLRGLVEADQDRTGLREAYREVLLAELDALPNYALGRAYFDEEGRWRMPLKVEDDRVWFVAPDIGPEGGKRLQVTSLLAREFDYWAAGAKTAEYLTLGVEPARVWEGL